MQKKMLITGISGFAGSYLAEHLLAMGNYRIAGTHLSPSTENINHIKSSVELFQIDLQNADLVSDLIQKVNPEYVYHLAALTSPADSFKDPAGVIINNVTAQINLLEAVRKNENLNCRVLVVSSADVYGKVGKKYLPISEDTPLTPTNPYAVSKITQDFIGLQYFLSYGLPIIRVRPFNHIGPRQGAQFSVASFAKKIAEIEKSFETQDKDKKDPVLLVGNLSTKRDFTDVRDVVRAYQSILEEGTFGEVYNIGSGKAWAMSEIVDKLLSMSKIAISVSVDPTLVRVTDTPELLCDSSKLRKTIHWEPKIDLDQTLKQTLDYWRGIV